MSANRDGNAIGIGPAAGAAGLEDARRLFLAYAESLGFSLCFQGFDEELATLPGQYAAPSGCLLLARCAGSAEAVGVVGVRQIAPGIAEMKRLYVVPARRGGGLGRRLAEAAVVFARGAGYDRLRLDTLATMTAAMALYRGLGFVEIRPYYDNPIPGARYFELALLRPA